MSELTEDGRAAPGLRERKKAKTKAAIQQHAVRLFRERGYDATTVEQVAEAAEVSPSTVFRYFPTKEDLVVSREYDPLFTAAFEAQPPELTPVQATRGALRAILGEATPPEVAAERERLALVLTVPQLWAASLSNITRMLRLMAELVGKRVGRDPSDAAVRAFVGAMFGIMLEVELRWTNEPDMDVLAAFDEAFAHLEAGLVL